MLRPKLIAHRCAPATVALGFADRSSPGRYDADRQEGACVEWFVSITTCQ